MMPTGTGKTEVMLSILVSCRCPKLLVIAPTDVLRSQLAEKFATLGVLKVPGCGLLNTNAKHPVVCMLHHIPNTPDEVDYIFARSHVIVTTSMVAGQSKEAVQDRMAHHCPYLFIDEAHHAEAPTWGAFKEKFKREASTAIHGHAVSGRRETTRRRHYLQIPAEEGTGGGLF